MSVARKEMDREENNSSSGPPRENSYPSGPAQTEHNNKPKTLLPGDRINDITWRGSK